MQGSFDGDKKIKMLDKSLEFHSIIMRNKNDSAPKMPAIPEGFSVRFYEKGDEKHWAEIQTAVLEFPTYDDALNCFNHYLDHIDELKRQQIYIVDDKTGKPVATSTAWFGECNGKRIGVVHGLSCLPEYQSLGLGRIAASCMMKSFYDIAPFTEVWLDTQTWSYKAIGIYMDLGFIPMKKETYSDVPNGFDDAVKVMKEKMRPDVYKKFLESAE